MADGIGTLVNHLIATAAKNGDEADFKLTLPAFPQRF